MRLQIYSQLRFFKGFLLLNIVIVCLSCSQNRDEFGTDRIPSPYITDTGKSFLKMMALGDSYTIGQGVSIAERFPAQTAALLALNGLKFATVDYIAATGWTTSQLLTAIAADTSSNRYDIVTLLIGVNNQYQGRDTTEYVQQFETCLQKAMQYANGKKGRVFVLSIPDYSVTPFGRRSDSVKITKEIDIFNAINARITAAYGIQYTNITQSTRSMPDTSFLASDGLHPSGKEYRKWADALLPKIVAALR